MRSLVIVLSLGTGLILLAGPARADIPPDPDSDDAHCSLVEQCPAGVLCEYAFNPGDNSGELDKVGEDCRKDAEKKGLQRRCRDGGNYGGQALYCPPGAGGTWKKGSAAVQEPTLPTPPETKPYAPPPPANGPAPATAPPAKTGNCDVRSGGSSGAPLLLVLLGLWSRRRRRAACPFAHARTDR